jgi:hypothetical protein
MNSDCPRTKLVIYRPDLKPVFERLSTAPKKPLNPQFIPLFGPRIKKKDEPSQQTIRNLPPSQSRSYAAFTLARQKLTQAMRVSSEPISGVCSQDTSFNTDIMIALRRDCFEKITDSPAKASPKTPSIKKLSRSFNIVRRPVVLEHSNGSMMMLFNSSFTSDSCPSSTTQVPAYIRSDDSELGDLPEEKTSGRLTRVPSLRDYPAQRFKVELQESVMTKLSLGQPLPTKTIKPDQPYYRVSTALKGSRVKQGPHAPFRPVLQRELTPNHFKRAVPGSKLV